MAKKNSGIYDIPLKTRALNLNTNRTRITPYEGFNSINSPYYGDVLTNWWTKKVDNDSHSTFVDRSGNVWAIKNNYLTKNGEQQKKLTNPLEKVDSKDAFGVDKWGNKIIFKLFDFFVSEDSQGEQYMKKGDGKESIYKGGFLQDIEYVGSYGDTFYFRYTKTKIYAISKSTSEFERVYITDGYNTAGLLIDGNTGIKNFFYETISDDDIYISNVKVVNASGETITIKDLNGAVDTSLLYFDNRLLDTKGKHYSGTFCGKYEVKKEGNVYTAVYSNIVPKIGNTSGANLELNRDILFLLNKTIAWRNYPIKETVKFKFSEIEFEKAYFVNGNIVGQDIFENVGQISNSIGINNNTWKYVYASTDQGYVLSYIICNGQLVENVDEGDKIVPLDVGYLNITKKQVVRTTETVNAFKVLNDRYLIFCAADDNLFDTSTNTWSYLASMPVSNWFPASIVAKKSSFDEYSTLNFYFNPKVANIVVDENNSNLRKPGSVFSPAPMTFNNISYWEGTPVNVNRYQPDFYSLEDKPSDIENDKGEMYINDVIYPPTIFDTFISDSLNHSIVKTKNNSYQLVLENNKNLRFGYRIDQQQEGVSELFTLQGQPYVIIDNIIYYYGDNISPIVNISGLKLMGYTPYKAFFFSEVNKTLYSFTGDNLLGNEGEMTNVGKLVFSKYNIENNTLYFADSDKLYILTDEQLIELKLGGIRDIYFTNEGFAVITEDSIQFFSENQISGYSKKDIELETMFYGPANSFRNINDCVYIRLLSNRKLSGTVAISSTTLNENSFTTETKYWDVKIDDWDEKTNTLLLRYQPKKQAAAGISLKLKSSFPICSLQISAETEEKENTPNNI